MTLLLYLATSLGLAALAHRFVRPLSRTAVLTLVALPMAITGDAVFTGGVYGPIDHPYGTEPLSALKEQYGIAGPVNASASDVYGEMFPWRRSVQASLQRGEWPLWNASMLAGHPLAANSQSAAWSPFTLIACLLPAAVSFTYTASVAMFIAGLGAFLFARDLDCGDAPSLVAAAGWSLAAGTIVYIHTAMGFTSVWQPMLLLAAGRVARAPAIGSGALLATVLALMILAGHPETLFLAVLAGCAFGLFEIVRSRGPVTRAITAAVIAGVIALMITAIHLLPFADALLQSAELEVKRKYWTPEVRALPDERVLAVLATDFFPWLHVRHWVRPAFGLTQAETAAVGSLVLALAVYGAWRRRSPLTWFFVVAGLFCLLVEAQWRPMVTIVQKLPLMGMTHFERLGFTAALCLAMLAAMGAEEIVRRRDRVAAAATIGCVLLVLSAGSWWLRRNIVLSELASDFGRYKLFAELFFPALAVCFLLAIRNAKRIPALLVVLVIAQRGLSEEGTFPTFPAEAAYPPIPILKPIEDARRPFRIVGQNLAFLPATSAFYGLEDVRGWEALTFAPFVHTWPLWCEFQVVWFNRVDDLTAPFLSFLNVRYAIVKDSADVPDGWSALARGVGAALLENQKVIERVFVPEKVSIGLTLEQQVEAMSRQMDFREHAWITAGVKPHERSNGPGSVAILSYSPGGRYLLDVAMKEDGWIVLSENGWRGWRAYIDGRRVRMQHANAAFLSVYVPKGRHQVRVVYWPESFVRGRAISFLTLLALALAGAFRAWRRRASAAPGRL